MTQFFSFSKLCDQNYFLLNMYMFVTVQVVGQCRKPGHSNEPLLVQAYCFHCPIDSSSHNTMHSIRLVLSFFVVVVELFIVEIWMAFPKNRESVLLKCTVEILLVETKCNLRLKYNWVCSCLLLFFYSSFMENLSP